MVKQCKTCQETFSPYKSWVRTDDQLRCKKCAKQYRDKCDKNEQHKRDVKKEEVRLRSENKRRAVESQHRSDVSKKEAEENAKVRIAEQERIGKEADNQRMIRVAEEETKQMQLKVSLAELTRLNKEGDVRMKELDLEIAEAEAKAKASEAKCAQNLAGALKTFQSMKPRQQQVFAEISKDTSFQSCKENIEVECDKKMPNLSGRKKTPWTMLHRTLNTS